MIRNFIRELFHKHQWNFVLKVKRKDPRYPFITYEIKLFSCDCGEMMTVVSNKYKSDWKSYGASR